MVNSVLGIGVLVNPYLFKAIIDELSRASRVPNSSGRILHLILVLAVLRLVIALFGYIQEAISDVMRVDVNIGLRKQLFKHILKLSIEYYETHRAGDITQQLSQGVYDFSSWVADSAENVAVQVIAVIVAAIAIGLKNPVAGLITLVAIPLHIGLSLHKIHKAKPLRRRGGILFEASIGVLAETIQNMTTVRTLGSESEQEKRYIKVTDELRETRHKQFPIEWWHNAGREIVEALATIGAVGVVALGALHGRYTTGDILLVALLIQQAMSNLRPIARFIDVTGEVATSCERNIELLRVQPTVVDSPGASELAGIESLEFRDVTFSYPGHDQIVLEDVSFKLDRGQTLALVGPSGTGKTTLVKLLLRLYEPTSGQILINNQPLADFTGDSLRQHMGVVMQDVALFNATFEENLRLARPSADLSELEQAVAMAHAKEFVDKFPDGYQTLVGERGIRLSGGQKQRLAIARALLKNPQVVILDEATSALDSMSEREVQAGLDSLTKNRMTVVIAHRLSTIRHASHILVIENGRVEESGSHEQLVKAKGLYAELYDMQSDRLLA